jgi:hypothetical protein
LRKLLQRDADDMDHASRVHRLTCADGAHNPAPSTQ